MKAIAQEYVLQPVSYSFTNKEKLIIKKFFTNHDKKVFFIRSLPPAVSTTLLSMYSRLKNERGIRGHFVDNLLILILTSFLPEFKNDEDTKGIQKFIKENGINCLDKFIEYSEETKKTFIEFLVGTNANAEYFKGIASSPKIRQFLSIFLDKYGHNSIARTGQEIIGIEDISLLAAKSLEWGRPGSGYIELSTRYVSMEGKALYPVWDEISCINMEIAQIVKNQIEWLIDEYRSGMREGKNSFSSWLFEKYVSKIPEEELKSAVFGEKCDVMGNLLPCATLTSVGVSVSGEALPELIKHLILDATPENHAIAELIMAESEKTGANQFLRHITVSEWKKHFWRYLDPHRFTNTECTSSVKLIGGPTNDELEKCLHVLFSHYDDSSSIENLFSVPRDPHDKLPNHFEFMAVGFSGIMSFRGWRDLHRMGFSTHFRTLVTPYLGFYRYDKPAPEWLNKKFKKIACQNRIHYEMIREYGIPSVVAQYPMALGNNIGFLYGENFLQAEFSNWQRTKFSVNHEVRQIFLAMEKLLRKKYPIWEKLSRADMTETYAFARTKIGFPL